MLNFRKKEKKKEKNCLFWNVGKCLWVPETGQESHGLCRFRFFIEFVDLKNIEQRWFRTMWSRMWQNTNSTPARLPQAIHLLCPHTCFAFSVLLGGVLGLGLGLFRWESGGGLLESRRWIWSTWNKKQDSWQLLKWSFCNYNDVLWIISESESKQEGVFCTQHSFKRVRKSSQREGEKPFSDLIRPQKRTFQVTTMTLFYAWL